MVTTISFAQGFYSMTEGQEAVIYIILDPPSQTETHARLTIESDAIYGEDYVTDPDLSSGDIQLVVAEAQDAIEVRIQTIDDSAFSGDRSVTFTITPTSFGLESGVITKHWVTILDDESPTVVEFATTTGTVDEKDATPQIVDLSLSSPVKGEGLLEVKIGGGVEYGVDFITTPEAQSGSVILKLLQDQTTASFSVTVLDDDSRQGDRVIPFSIYGATGPIRPGSVKQQYMLTVIDDEEPIIVEGFTSSDLQLDESDTEGADIGIRLSAPAARPAEILVEVLGFGGQVVCDPPVENFYESYLDYYYVVLDVATGTEEVSFHVEPVDNAQCGASSPVTFSIYSTISSVTLGNSSKVTLSFLDNEPYIHATLVEAEGELVEDASTGLKVEFQFSEPLPGASRITMYLDYYTNFYSGRFKVVPDFLEYSSSSYTYGFLDCEAGATGVSFEVVPVDDDEKNGDFSEVFNFYGSQDQPCVTTGNATYTMSFIDDDQ